ncbi:Calcipressin-like protein [Aphelenchoides fujianensis]|nr:Calcipressin-like protein [Aphelenchoides fujianensis]
MAAIKRTASPINHKDDLPTAIIIKSVPKSLFESDESKENFANLFLQIDPNARIDYLKGFQRVRVVFQEPEQATAAKLLVEHHSFDGCQMKAFFAQNIKFTRRAYQDEQGHLKLPPLEKQFLISPPASPPVGWIQSSEMAPVVCDFDLMSRLAAYSVEDDYEVHEGHADQPTIVVSPCKFPPGGGAISGSESPVDRPPRARTPRPPLTPDVENE